MSTSSKDSGELNALSDAFAQAVENASRSTVLVDARRRMPASGIVYTPELVLTADHVLEREEEIRVILPDGKQIQAAMAGRDSARDLALIRLNQSIATPAEPATQPARVGQLSLALGRPDHNGIQASLGVVSAIGGPVRLERGGVLEQYLRTDAIPYPGFSGGPLVNSRGQAMGLNTSGLSMGSLLTIPIEIAWQAAASLAAHGHIRRGYLGIRSQPVKLSHLQVEALKREQDTALLLVNVEEGSPAANAGLVTGDLLVGIAGQSVRDHDELQAHLDNDAIGKALAFEILRGTSLSVITVVVGERN